MKRDVLAWVAAGFALILATVAILQSWNPAKFHFEEFADIKTRFNDYEPSLIDRLRGIQNNSGKFDFHLRRLMELDAVRHETFVFTEVPYTREAVKPIWTLAASSFPNAVWYEAKYHDADSPGYGTIPYVMEVWDVPGEMDRWRDFFEANNRRPPSPEKEDSNP